MQFLLCFPLAVSPRCRRQARRSDSTDSDQRHEFKSKRKHDRVAEPIDAGRERSKKRHDRPAESVKRQLRSQKNAVVARKGKGKSPSSLIKAVKGKKRKMMNQDAQFDYGIGRRQPKTLKSK